MPDGSVSGSVIQRTFVGGEVSTALFAASVPLDEVGMSSGADDSRGFHRVVGEILGVPQVVLLDERQYFDAVRGMTRRDWPRRMMRYGPFFEEWFMNWERRQGEITREVGESGEPSVRIFAEHTIALLVSPDRTLTPWLGLTVSPDELSAEFGIKGDETATSTGVACFNARLQRSKKTADFTSAVLQYDLPFGNSPKASSDSLLKLLESGKKMCLAPVAAGGTVGIGFLTQGHYVAAILCTGTVGVMTLILLGTIAVGSLLISRISQRRPANT
jgi:hypothetical protein